MAQEWKKNEHYVANNTTLGDNIPVEELDDDELLGLSRSRVARGECGSRRLSRSSKTHIHQEKGASNRCFYTLSLRCL